jgi:flagellar L-ring protein FlgH
MKNPTCAIAVAIGGVLMLGAAAPLSAQSLYDEAHFRPLTADNKASHIGDVLTIQVVENATATVNADTGSQRSNGLTVDLTRPKAPSLSAGLGTSSDFDGGGRTERAGRLLAQLTVKVDAVLPNGDLLVSGEQQLTINDERQRIAISGRVRPVDISEGNVVLSSRVADADITYVGDGLIASKQRPPWWRQALDALGF